MTLSNESKLSIIMGDLSKPFDPALIQWKPGATTKDGLKAMALAYADTRAYVERLNVACGGEWSDDYEVQQGGTVVLCKLSIKGVTRCDIGEAPANDRNTATSALAQAFKRACAKFGLGAYLYSLPAPWVEYDSQRKRFTSVAMNKLCKIAGGNGRVATPPASNGKAAVPVDNGNGDAFPNKSAAIKWAMERGAFEIGKHAANAYDKVKREGNPKSAGEMGRLWRADVTQRLAEAESQAEAA